MVIVFTSPKKRQRLLLRVITFVLIFLLFIISLIIFPPQFIKEGQLISEKAISDIPTIDFNVINSDQFKNLEPFELVQVEFNYVAKDKNAKQVVGKILADSKDEAKRRLEELGFEVLSLQEADIGRSEPFEPYYQTTEKTNLK